MTTIAVDFDGTCVDHKFPEMGIDIPGAVTWLKTFVDFGALLILWTMRSDSEDTSCTYLADAVKWFADHEIPLYGVNNNPSQCWSTSPKAYANVYIDDAAACCPLRNNPRVGGRPYVNWDAVGPAVLYQILCDQRPATPCWVPPVDHIDAARLLIQALGRPYWVTSIGTGEIHGKPGIHVMTRRKPPEKIASLKSWCDYPIAFRECGDLFLCSEAK